MKRERLVEILSKLPEQRIAVLGDLFLDKWLQIDRSLDETSRETGLAAYQVVGMRLYAGAGGTVLSNLAALEAGTLYAIGFLGDDGEGYETLRLLRNIRVDTSRVFVSAEVMTPTYTKPVFMLPDGDEETHRLDHKNVKQTPAHLERKIMDAIWEIAPKVDAVIALDQLDGEGCGVLTPAVRKTLAEAALQFPDTIFYADSRAHCRKFENVVIKCNDIEIAKIFQPEAIGRLSLEETKALLPQLASRTGRQVFVTCGEKGVLVQRGGKEPVLIPTLPQTERIDIVGAGDACTAGIVTALCAGGTVEEAAFLGNLVSSVTIQTIGTTGTATRKQVVERYEEFERKGGILHG